ncbi:MAG: bifunctional oligoribonuclease/PAP phosphatase NrnA [Desulfovibrionaceae bacterium]
MPSTPQEIAKIIKENDEFLVAAHVNPDGDAIGSCVALGWILQKLGKRFVLYNETGLPRQFDWMSLPQPLVTELPANMPAWTLIADCGALSRVGPALADRFQPEFAVNIDHHLSNPFFAAHNWVDIAYPAVGAMIAEIADMLGLELSGPLGEAVYVAVATDTGFFTYGSTKPETLELTARLYRLGIKPGEINPKIINQWSRNKLDLLAKIMNGLTMHLDGAMGLVGASLETQRATNTTAEDCEGLVNFVRRLRDVRVSAILREDAPDYWKFSLRSNGDDNIEGVASLLGGGGHKNAAGGNIAGNFKQASTILVNAVAKVLGLEN